LDGWEQSSREIYSLLAHIEAAGVRVDAANKEITEKVATLASDIRVLKMQLALIGVVLGILGGVVGTIIGNVITKALK
jgi:hypothetical protein